MKRLLILILLLVSTVSDLALAQREQLIRTYEIELGINEAPTDIIITLFGAESLREVNVKKLKSDSLGGVTAIVDIDPTVITADSHIAALSILSDGRTVASQVKSLSPGLARDSFAGLPICARGTESAINLEKASLNKGLFESLLGIREERLKLARVKIKATLTDELLVSLQKLEKALGLIAKDAPPLSSELPLFELQQRLWRLEQALPK